MECLRFDCSKDYCLATEEIKIKVWRGFSILTGFFEGFLNEASLPLKDIIIRLFLAALIGFLLGLEREVSLHPAGIKTHTLVCLGSALASLIACEMAFFVGELQEPQIRLDISRIAAGVVSGMGFIGAGAIMKSRDGTMVTGITTAATLWVTACLGLALGMGQTLIGVIAFIIVIFFTLALKKAEKRFFVQKRERSVDITLINKNTTLPFLDEFFESKKIRIITFQYKKDKSQETTAGDPIYNCRYVIRTPRGIVLSAVLRELALEDNILEIFETFHGKDVSLDFRKAEEDKSSE